MSGGASEIKVQPFAFDSAGWCPNNLRLPLLVYRQVSDEAPGDDLARWFEETFRKHGWPPEWRYTIYPFPHYHSTSHEVIGVFRGRAKIRFGDSAGQTLEVQAGDVVLIPAGVSHQRLSDSDNFCGVGAYPVGYERDLIRQDEMDVSASASERIVKLVIPELDPVTGCKEPLRFYWK